MSGALERVAELVRRETGIVLRDPQLAGLTAALGRVEPGIDARGFLSHVERGPGGGALLERLVDEITVQETYFYRESRELEAIEWGDLARRAAKGATPARIWVAACATGEEAYTLAILASEAFGGRRPPVTILATDISTAALDAAAGARYSGRTLRRLPPHALERYFVPDGRGYRLRDGIRSLVRFERHNLVSEPSPPAWEARFDVIVCRNVLIYFDRPTVESVIGALESALAPGGQLILGAADKLPGTTGRLDRVWARPIEPRRRAHAPRREPNRERRRRVGLESPVRGPDPERDIGEAVRAADAGELEAAIARAAAVVEADPLNADAYFVRGLAELGRDEAMAAISSFRRALYVDPAFGLAAFKLGRAHEARGDSAAARRAYEHALRTLRPDDERHRTILDQVDVADVAAACRMRLASVGEPRAG